MADIRFKLNRAGVHELLTSSVMAGICAGYATQMSAASGVEWVTDIHTGPNRVNAAAHVSKEIAKSYRGSANARRNRH